MKEGPLGGSDIVLQWTICSFFDNKISNKEIIVLNKECNVVGTISGSSSFDADWLHCPYK